jgi:hypothetical protein
MMNISNPVQFLKHTGARCMEDNSPFLATFPFYRSFLNDPTAKDSRLRQFIARSDLKVVFCPYNLSNEAHMKPYPNVAHGKRGQESGKQPVVKRRYLVGSLHHQKYETLRKCFDDHILAGNLRCGEKMMPCGNNRKVDLTACWFQSRYALHMSRQIIEMYFAASK